MVGETGEAFPFSTKKASTEPSFHCILVQFTMTQFEIKIFVCVLYRLSNFLVSKEMFNCIQTN